MTPEERAQYLVETHGDNLPQLKRFIATHMLIAVQAERERCASIAESFIPSGFAGNFGIARDDQARTIAAAIRGEVQL